MGLLDFLSDIPIVGDLFGSKDDGDGGSSIPIVGDVLDAAGNYLKAGLNAPLNNYYRHQQMDDAKDMMRFSSDLQQENWQNQFSTITQYNDPAAAAARMRNGGFSPAAMFGTGGSAMFSSATPNSGLPSTPSGFYGGNTNFSSLAQALNLASQTKLNLARLPEVEANVQSLLAKAGLDDSQKSLNELSLKLQSVYGDQMYKSNIAKNVGDYLNKLAQAELFNAQGDTQRAEKLLKEAQADLAKSQKVLTESQKTLVDIDARYEEARIQADIDAKKAQAQEARAGAKRNLAQAEYMNQLSATESQMRDGAIEMQSLHNDLLTIEKFAKGRHNSNEEILNDQYLQAQMNMLAREGLLNEKVQQEIKMAVQENDWYRYGKLIESINGALGNAIGAYNAGSMRINALTSEKRTAISQKIADAVERNSMTKNHTRRVYDSDGNLNGWFTDTYN